MAIWAISLVGIGPILDYLPTGVEKAEHSGFLFLVVINAVVAVWAAPAVSSPRNSVCPGKLKPAS